MSFRKRQAFALAALLSFASTAFPAVAAEVKIGMLVSSTRPAVVVGVPQRNSAKLLPAKVSPAGVESSSSTTAVTRRLPSTTPRG